MYCSRVGQDAAISSMEGEEDGVQMLVQATGRHEQAMTYINDMCVSYSAVSARLLWSKYFTQCSEDVASRWTITSNGTLEPPT
jgi:hypothetical protein